MSSPQSPRRTARSASTHRPPKTPRSTSGACRRIASSSGPISRASASGIPCEREFYKERNVVQEERRMRIDSAPIGRMVEQFLATAYVAHPYGAAASAGRARSARSPRPRPTAFHEKYYVPSNIVIAVVGDVKASEAMPVLERYFAPIPAGPKPEPMTTIEPPQVAEKFVTIREATQPFYIEGYHRPDYRDPDDSVYDAITDIFSNGRTARLYRSLVRDQAIAAEAAGLQRIPRRQVPRPLRRLRGSAARATRRTRCGTAIHKELDRLKNEDITDEELARFKTRATRRPAARPRQQRRPRPSAGRVPDTLRRLAAAIPPTEQDRRRQQSGCAPRGQQDLRRQQPNQRTNRVRRTETTSPGAAAQTEPATPTEQNAGGAK